MLGWKHPCVVDSVYDYYCYNAVMLLNQLWVDNQRV